MEFGSDFHIFEYPKGSNSPLGCSSFNLYASGRQALYHLLKEKAYKRLWIPSYFCGESIMYLDGLPVTVRRYPFTPVRDPDTLKLSLPVKETDLLLIVNYFGLRGFRDSSSFGCDVIEDHTHCLIGEWAVRSNAKWCYASLRKSIPVADGGVLWSPLSAEMPVQPAPVSTVRNIMTQRYKAMRMKSDYLSGGHSSKEEFLNLFRATEETFADLPLSRPVEWTQDILNQIDIKKWYWLKKRNYNTLVELLHPKHSEIIFPEKKGLTPFSLLLSFRNHSICEEIRERLISEKIYPAVLWADVDQSDPEAVEYSSHILSLHCDGRYDNENMRLLASKLNTII